MNREFTATEQEELFAIDCKPINLRYEYTGYTGTEKYGIITELTEKELYEKYGAIIGGYEPFILLSASYGEVLNDFRRNEDKHGKRAVNNTDCFGYDDGTSPLFHSELCCYDKTEDDEEDEQKKEENKKRQLLLLEEALTELTEIQRRRIKAAFFDGKTRREIAAEEGVNYSKIDKSIVQALKKMKKFFEKRGCKTLFDSE